MPETWAEQAEREMKAGRERRRAESAKTWAERTEHEQRAEALERTPTCPSTSASG